MIISTNEDNRNLCSPSQTRLFNGGYKNIQTTLKAATPPITMLDHRPYDIYDSCVATL